MSESRLWMSQYSPRCRRLGSLVAVSLLCLTGVTFAAETVVFRCDFNRRSDLEAWKGKGGRLAPGYRGGALLIENPSSEKPVQRTIELPAQRLAGKLVTIQAVVKAENVSEPSEHWNGIRVRLTFEPPPGANQVSLPVGSFDWRPVKYSFKAPVPDSITQATLHLGLERASGSVWFDEIEIRVASPGATLVAGRRASTRFTGHDLERLRGVTGGLHLDEEYFRILAQEWHANQVRLILGPERGTDREDLDAYDKGLEESLSKCDKALDACKKYGLKVLLDLHFPPGGAEKQGSLKVTRLFTQRLYQEKFIEVWTKIAKRYKGRQGIYAYDLLNEPIESAAPTPGLLNWRELAVKATQAIRTVEPGKPVVFEPGLGGHFNISAPLDIDRVIYSFHMYSPHSFTDQGVEGTPYSLTGNRYPGVFGGEMWDKERLRKEMKRAIEFQRKFSVQIYVGEFSAARWAPGACDYLQDLIELFEEYGWDWSYHSYRSAECWDVERGSDQNDRKRSPTPTDRKQLLLKWFALNERAEP